ncbi:ArsR/SmtB family transcription factor [Kribbella deserti]|uniref:DUF5937 family protein n=1 Tax=Kribbella deserti TaxID=1926257 RepID=A0ABV6QQ46_9ACTN
MPSVLTGLTRLTGEQVRLVVSPLLELGSALHVLAAPDHHDRAEWADRVKATMTPAENAELDAWSWTYRAVRARIFVTYPVEEPEAGPAEGNGWQRELARLRSRPTDELAADLVRPLQAGSGDLDSVRHWARSRGREVDVLVAGLLTDPDRPVERFLDLLDRCWQAWFAADWAQVAPKLTVRGRHDRDLAIRQGLASMLTSLDPAIDGKPGADSVVAQRLHSKRLDVGSRGLLLVPSAFVAPHLYLTDVPGHPISVIYPFDGTAGPAVPTAKALQTRLETLAAPIALRICRAVASEPRTAGEIASLWNLNSTQVTRHLRALTRAGVVTAAREGRFVTYRLDHAALRDLGDELLTLIMR